MCIDRGLCLCLPGTGVYDLDRDNEVIMIDGEMKEMVYIDAKLFGESTAHW